MTKKDRAGLSGFKKTVLVALFLLVAWQVVQNDKVTNTLAGLLFGGVVPGTNKVLSPTTMIYSAGGGGILVALLVTTHFVRRYKRLYPKATQQTGTTPGVAEDEIAAKIPFVEAPIKEPVTEHVPAKTMAMPAELAVPTLMAATQEIDLGERRKERMRAQRRLMFVPFLAAVTMATRRFLALTKVGNTKLSVTLQYASRYTSRGAQIFFQYALKFSKTSYVLFVKASVSARKNIIKASITTWQWLSPYLWRFDGWLELQVRGMEAWSRKKASQHEDAKLVFDIARGSIKLMRQSTAKIIKKITPSQKDSEEFDE